MKYFHHFLLLLAVFLAVTTFVRAQPSTKISLSITPTYQEIVFGEAEAQKEVQFSLSNNTDQVLQVRFFSIDIKQQDITGKIEYIPDKKTDNPYALTSHITFPRSTISIEPRKSADVRVIIKNDKNLFPGGHYAGIISQAQYVNEKSQPILIPALTTQLFVRKTGGERAGLNLISFDFPKHYVLFTYPDVAKMVLHNVGNVHLIPYGSVQITDTFGRNVYKGIINDPSLRIFPQTKREIPVNFFRLTWSFPISLHTATVEGTDSFQAVSYSKKFTFLYINIYFLIIFILIVLMSVVFRKVIRKILKKIFHR